MELFGNTSGLKVNYRKSTATLIRGEAEEEVLVSNLLRCNLAVFPIRYLGLQLGLRSLTKTQWQVLIDRVVDWLPAWQRGLIAKQGRLILIKSVVMARPAHNLLVEDPPVWVVEEIDRWCRAFFWAGKERVNGGQCLVAWDTICKPYEFGGLGVKDLRLQGLALRVRWEWLRRTDQSMPWQGLPAMSNDMACAVFDSLVTIQVGRGDKVLFWRDRWLQGRSAEDIAPAVVAAVSVRRRNSRTVQQAMLNNMWTRDRKSVV